MRDCSKKIRSAYRAKALNGEFTAPYAPIGYQKDPANPRRLIPDERAPIVRRMFRMALEGNTCSGIAKTLEREQVPTPLAYLMERTGGYVTEKRKKHPCNWDTASVRKILSNPVYLGHMVGQKASTRTELSHYW